jgi:2-hydroxychromene-2-carboxylate isomerase
VRPTQFPRNGLLAARIVAAAQDEAWVPAFVCNVYLASFAHDLDIADPNVLKDCLRDLTSDPDAQLAASQDDAAKARLRENTERAVALGIFGSPSFTSGTELFWGNDRLEAALEWQQPAG